MILSTMLSLMLAATAQQQPATAAAPPGQEQCGQGLNINLVETGAAQGGNVVMVKFEETSPEDRCVRNIKPDEFVRLHQRIKPIATKAFAHSEATFGVMVRYTLTADKPALVNMQVASAPASEKERLDLFYKQATALTNFHSTSGTVYLVFQFNITPAPPRKHAKGK